MKLLIGATLLAFFFGAHAFSSLEEEAAREPVRILVDDIWLADLQEAWKMALSERKPLLTVFR